jgi:peptide-methionine (R)-S-oxide reductase
MEKIERSEEEWRQILDPERYQVLRKKGTEPPFNNEFWNEHTDGLYLCGACDLTLFSSEDKFDSGSGWPSFTQPISADVVEITGDSSHGMNRDEVVCARCGSHLGHVFEDGPKPLGTRYCLNSLSLKFTAETY